MFSNQYLDRVTLVKRLTILDTAIIVQRPEQEPAGEYGEKKTEEQTKNKDPEEQKRAGPITKRLQTGWVRKPRP